MSGNRQAGVLLHPTSLPGPYGIGELGAEAYRFVDFLVRAGQSLWQVLPLGPTGYGDSPYASFSTFAGNPLLISIDALVDAGDLSAPESAPPRFAAKIDYGKVLSWKLPLLETAALRFLSRPDQRAGFDEFCRREAFWLDDFALFMSVKAEYQRLADAEGLWGRLWSNFWDLGIRLRRPEAVAEWSARLAESIAVHKVFQYWFFTQWTALKAYANERGVRIVGDIPIFVAADSVDVWANRRFFRLDGQGQPLVVAGVPPDYFSATGQLWGNPLYDWEALAADGFRWWIERIRATLRLVDLIRIDHFRGFESYWEVPFGAPDAVRGRWIKAPGRALFEAVRRELGSLPLLAEDLGIITHEVEALRDEFGFPGMKILQFAFDAASPDGGAHPFLPHNYGPNCVVYTGTHDNDTTRGWLTASSQVDRDYALGYVNGRPEEGAWAFVRAALASPARYAVVPAQDLLDLPSSARMNTPSTVGGNWAWRLPEGFDAVADRLGRLTRLYGRAP